MSVKVLFPDSIIDVGETAGCRTGPQPVSGQIRTIRNSPVLYTAIC